MTDKPMTVGELIKTLSKLDQNLPVHIMSPEGLMMSKDLCINTDLIQWYGHICYIFGTNWFRKPNHD